MISEISYFFGGYPPSLNDDEGGSESVVRFAAQVTDNKEVIYQVHHADAGLDPELHAITEDEAKKWGFKNIFKVKNTPNEGDFLLSGKFDEAQALKFLGALRDVEKEL